MINSLESESGIIATLIHHPEYIYYSEHLMPEHFTARSNQVIYAAIGDLVRRGIEKVDPYNIMEAVNAGDLERRFGAHITIDQLNELVYMSGDLDGVKGLARSSSEEYELLVENVLDAAFRREAVRSLQKSLELCYKRDSDNIKEEIYRNIDDVMLRYTKSDEVREYKDVVDDLWDKIEARQRGNSDAIEFPFPALNEYAIMEPGELICFTGGPKSGKSTMLLTVTVDMLRQGKSVLYIDSEISTQLFTLRLLSHLTRIRFADMRDGNYNEEQKARILDAIAWLKTRKFIHMYLPIFDENAVYLAAKRAQYMIGIDCIVVDYLKSTNEKDEAFAVYAEMGRFSDTLKNKICGDMKICGLTAAQATNTGKIADSSKIARSVSTVISIMDKSPEEMDESDPFSTKKIRVVFNRNGPQMSEGEYIDMSFEGSMVTYRQSEHQHEELVPY